MHAEVHVSLLSRLEGVTSCAARIMKTLSPRWKNKFKSECIQPRNETIDACRCQHAVQLFTTCNLAFHCAIYEMKYSNTCHADLLQVQLGNNAVRRK
jgi:hypothetical protein